MTVRQMAQPYDVTQKLGSSLWSAADIARMYGGAHHEPRDDNRMDIDRTHGDAQ